MATRSYKLYSTTVTTADSKASLKITRRGVITAISFTHCGLAGAGVDGFYRAEVSKQSASSFTTNDTPPTVIAYSTGGAVGVNSGAYCSKDLQAGLNNPVEIGDTLYIHVLSSGTAASAGTITCTLTVNE